jgi:hypothetical protein
VPLPKKCLFAVVLLLSLAACQREAAAPAADPQAAAPPAAAEDAPDPAAVPELKDVIETTDRYVIGVSYPPSINRYPGLAQAVHAYTEQARAALVEAAGAFGNDTPPAPYELSLGYHMLLETPSLVALAADGSRYTGGAHGEPLVERFVWLPQEQRMLDADALVPALKGWAAIGSYVREQLHTSASVRAEADDLPPEERLRLVRNADKLIEEGTGPEVENFSRYEPVTDGSGRITALRFVFPPYQVGPYADGTQSVEVPTSVVLPHVAPEYRRLFAEG